MLTRHQHLFMVRQPRPSSDRQGLVHVIAFTGVIGNLQTIDAHITSWTASTPFGGQVIGQLVKLPVPAQSSWSRGHMTPYFKRSEVCEF